MSLIIKENDKKYFSIENSICNSLENNWSKLRNRFHQLNSGY